MHLFELDHCCRAHPGGNCLRQLSSCECIDSEVKHRPSFSQVDGLQDLKLAEVSKWGEARRPKDA